MDASMKRAVKNMIEEEDEGDEWNGMEWNCEVNKKYFIKKQKINFLLFNSKIDYTRLIEDENCKEIIQQMHH
ncbi:hypothetical protein T4B_15161 [Trichinella pseudospiralis]|uniref:Uncharacterized protein n=1 Tax=Trichinella pseudospiralis TaxID=6337 RepID=A0A0V1HRA4_TRIPS|nr:hypothetical protein T4B_15161 [Trichinella pseudospiralis]KRZ32105.1 hypothetical protein T4C_7704 [Trichinella pseudospiralis]